MIYAIYLSQVESSQIKKSSYFFLKKKVVSNFSEGNGGYEK